MRTVKIPTFEKLLTEIPIETRLLVLFQMDWLTTNIVPDREATDEEIIKMWEANADDKIVIGLLEHIKVLNKKIAILSCEHEFVYYPESGFKCSKCDKKGRRQLAY